MDYTKFIARIYSTMESVGEPLTDTQKIVLSGSLAVWMHYPRVDSKSAEVDMRALIDHLQNRLEAYSCGVASDCARASIKAADQLRKELEEKERQLKILSEAIRKAAVKAGICREDADLTGAHLLMLCDDLAFGCCNQKPKGD